MTAVPTTATGGDATATVTSSDHTPTPESSVVTPPGDVGYLPLENISGTEYRLERALIREFDVGTTFGMPKALTEEQIDLTAAEHPTLADRIRRDFDADDNRSVYTRIRQFQQVSVDHADGDTYRFSIRSGHGCSVTRITGAIDQGTDEVTVANRTSLAMPC